MSITGDLEGPPFRLGVAIADLVSGMFAAQGTIVALLAREKTGRGQQVDVGMLDSVVALLTYQAGIFFATGLAPTRMGNRHPSIAPYETFAARDGDFVLAVGNDEQWRRFCAVAGLDGLATDPRFQTNRQRVTNYPQLRPRIADALKMQSRRSWIERLSCVGVPCGAVRDLQELFSDAQVEAREMVKRLVHATIGEIRVVGTPIKLSDTPGRIDAAPPLLGQHTERILEGDLGLSKDEIRRLRERHVV